MNDPNLQVLIRRIERVEQELANLHAKLDVLVGNVPKSGSEQKAVPSASDPVTPSPQNVLPVSTVAQPPEEKPPTPRSAVPAPPPGPMPADATVATTSGGFSLPEYMRTWEYWLNKIGIGLVLFAVVFLFKYSVEQGWLNPVIRVGLALALGTALLIVGMRLYKKRRHFGLVLLGGGIATYYITGFAAFQLFELVSHPTAFGFMVLVTALAFLMSVRQDEAVLSVVATIGGLGTPFLLYTSVANFTGLTVYLSILMLGGCGVYIYKGWRSVLWVAAIGIWSIYFIYNYYRF